MNDIITIYLALPPLCILVVLLVIVTFIRLMLECGNLVVLLLDLNREINVQVLRYSP
jgi:hypothetical protein